MSSALTLRQEWRDNLHQTSHCFLAWVHKDTGVTALEDDEIKDGLVHEWVSFEVAMERLKNCQPTSELGRFIQERDLFFLEFKKDMHMACKHDKKGFYRETRTCTDWV